MPAPAMTPGGWGAFFSSYIRDQRRAGIAPKGFVGIHALAFSIRAICIASNGLPARDTSPTSISFRMMTP